MRACGHQDGNFILPLAKLKGVLGLYLPIDMDKTNVHLYFYGHITCLITEKAYTHAKKNNNNNKK